MTNVITLTRIVYSAELFFCPVKSGSTVIFSTATNTH